MTTTCNIILKIVLLLTTASCGISKIEFEPSVNYIVTDRTVKELPTPFPPLKKEELEALWGKELYLGVRFAQDGDWYRALTAFKSALYLLPKKESIRLQQLQFYVVLTYYFAGKWEEALSMLEAYDLAACEKDFPAYRELALVAIDLYSQQKVEKPECEYKEAFWLDQLSSCDKDDIELSIHAKKGDLEFLASSEKPVAQEILAEYYKERKSPSEARFRQAILPGLGYYYVGLKQAAVTSFVINSLFIFATYQFFERGYPALALFTLSLESGWYLGGINGAGIAANEFNENLYRRVAKDRLSQNKLFPVLMLQYGF
jgi:hypothetical protein